ncbi:MULTISPECIES: hypothetical protein [unclassified Cellvibrio]|uniref:hypothetical protein n=1 Tax=unclassified Cellvibrio TaxID=2624793 RepID=UPI00066FF427|nr:hypothetical protein [Cellvibrio sp. pealriver]
MPNNSISCAIKILEDLLAGLSQAYWEANSLDRKDFFFDLISALHAELSELGKLSVQDHDLDYEPVTEEFRAVRPKLSRLRKLVDDFALRSTTAVRLEHLINESMVLMGRNGS